MKKVFTLLLISFSILTSCNKKDENFIDTGTYYIVSYKVKNVADIEVIKEKTADNSFIKIDSNQNFTTSKGLSELVFNNYSFKYKVKGDSLLLSNNKTKKVFKILKADINSFKLKIDNEYFETIYFIKNKNDRKKITRKISVVY